MAEAGAVATATVAAALIAAAMDTAGVSLATGEVGTLAAASAVGMAEAHGAKLRVTLSGTPALHPGTRKSRAGNPVGPTSGYVFVLVVQVLGGNVVFRYLASGYLGNIGVEGVFDPLDSIGLEGVALFRQFLHTLRIRFRGIRHLLDVARLSG
jgi:hypothetical protein